MVKTFVIIYPPKIRTNTDKFSLDLNRLLINPFNVIRYSDPITCQILVRSYRIPGTKFWFQQVQRSKQHPLLLATVLLIPKG